MKKGVDYYLISELPQEDQELFKQWLRDAEKEVPVVSEEGLDGFNCCWVVHYHF